MFKLNLKIALRNLWKNKAYAFISIAGLAVALTIFILAALYANYQRSFDTWNKGYTNIYRVNYFNPTENVALSPGNMASYSKDKIAAVASATRIQDYWWGDLLVKTKAKSLYLKNILMADSNFFKVFAYPALYGNVQQALNSPQSVVLSKETSEIIYGKGVNPVGETIMLNNKEGYLVDAVIDVARYPSHFKFNMIRRFRKSASDEYYSNNYYTYVKLQAGSDIKQTEGVFNQTRNEILNAELKKLPLDEQSDFADFIKSDHLYLQPIKDIHLTKSNVEYDFSGNGIGIYMYMMLVVAVLVLIIAAVNFTNLSVTMATRRAKETGVRKVLGAHKIQIGVQFILETALQCLLSFIMALIAVELLLPAFNQMLGTTIVLDQWKDYEQIMAQIAIVLVVLTFLVGLYPAMMISNIIPAKVLKGNFGSGHSGTLLRNVLIVLQFSIAVLFISGIWIINSQLDFMQNKDLGYKPRQVLAITMMQDASDTHFYQIKNTLKSIPGVNSISRADHIPGEDMGGNSYTVNGKNYTSGFITIDAGYFTTMGMKLVEGREYSPNIVTDTMQSIIVTETAAKSFNLVNPVGKNIRSQGTDHKVIGLVKDFNHYSPEKAIQPLVFQFMQGNALRYVLINIGSGNSAETVAKIEQEWTKLEPQFPIKYTFLDQTFAQLLQSQQQLRSIIGLLSIVTIVLALMGLFAIAAFNTQRRSKEISIRKVLGASMLDILKLLNRKFVVLVLLSNLIAWPVAYLVLNHWLSGFASRIELSLLPFMLSGLFTLLLTITIVSLQSYKAANANPVDSLKYE